MRRRRFITFLGGVAAAVFHPITVHPQQRPAPVIGYLSGGARATPSPGLYRGLAETGYVEGQNLAIEYRWAEGAYDQLPKLAAELVARKVEALVAMGMPSALAAKSATSTIPIIFNVGVDPVADGLVAGLSRPGGNLTGVSIISTELMPKRLELLLELLPQVRSVALLVNPNNASAEPQSRDLQEAAHAKGVQLHILKAGSGTETDVAFASLDQLHADALVVGTDISYFGLREQLAALVARHAVPAIYELREFAEAGGLMSYGPSQTATNRQLGIHVGKILNGAKPANLPVERPTKFELVINLKTAKALGLTVPQSLLVRADEVVE